MVLSSNAVTAHFVPYRIMTRQCKMYLLSLFCHVLLFRDLTSYHDITYGMEHDTDGVGERLIESESNAVFSWTDCIYGRQCSI